MISESDTRRFWDFVDKSEECWIWTGGTRPSRKILYGVFQIKLNGKWKAFSAHRISYEIKNGREPGELFVCHTCDNGLCVRPEHLFLGTHQDNMDDMYNKGRRVHKKPYQKKPYRKAVKLTSQEVEEIIAALEKPYWGQVTSLAKKYGVTHSMISHIKSGRFRPAGISLRENN